jgi:AhpD family alkylhydroperoxidase
MQARLNIQEHASAAYGGMFHLEQVIGKNRTLPEGLLHLIKTRASQISGCAFCTDLHAHDAKDSGESDDRLFSVATWREAPYFTDAERAALALAEAATRIADNPEGVPDDVWQEAAKHYTEPELAELVMVLATIRAWNTINVTIRQPASPEIRAQIVAGRAKR